MRPVRILPCVCALLMLSVADVSAQEQSRITGSADLNAAVVTRAQATEQNRTQLRALLDRPEVRDIARAQNIDLARVQAGVGTLTAEELQEISPLAQSITTALAGGQSITITVTTLIIVLLLIILIVLVAD